MAILDIIPNENVNIQDIIDTLTHHGAVFTYQDVDDNGVIKSLDLTQLFSENAKNNKWAKYKPHIHPSLFKEYGDYNTEDKRAGLTIKYAVLSDNGTYTQNAVRGLYTDAENWSYNLPKGGEKEPFRFGDYRGYQANSYPLLRANYAKNVVNRVPSGTGVFSFPFYSSLPRDIADSDGEGATFDLSKNLQFSDIDMYIEGGWYNLGDGYLACFVVKQNSSPIDYGFNWFDLTSLRLCDKKLKDGGDEITVYDFVTGVDANTTSETYWLVGGIVLKGTNKDIFLSIPYFDDTHYHSVAFQKYTPSYSMSLEVTGWSKYPTESVWHDIKWAATDDYIAYPASNNSYLKLRVDVDLSSWSSNTFTFTAQNTRIYCPTTGKTQYCSIYNKSFNIEASAGVINGSGTLYLGADDLFTMTDLYDQYDIEVQVMTSTNKWETLYWVGFEGRSSY